MAAEILAAAFVLEGRYPSAFPMFGAERRGAPVTAFLRFDDKPVRLMTQIYEPDCIVVLDPAQLKPSTLNGLKPNGTLILNTSKPVTDRLHPNISMIGYADATGVALAVIGRPIVNTCILGIFAKTTGWVTLDAVLSSLEAHFSGSLLQKNIEAVRQGFEVTKLINYGDKRNG